MYLVGYKQIYVKVQSVAPRLNPVTSPFGFIVGASYLTCPPHLLHPFKRFLPSAYK